MIHNVKFHKNLLKHFVESKDISSFKSTRGILVGVCNAARDKLISKVQPLEKVSAIDSLKYYYLDREKVDQSLYLRKGYKYHSQTAAGDCGSQCLDLPQAPRSTRQRLMLELKNATDIYDLREAVYAILKLEDDC